MKTFKMNYILTVENINKMKMHDMKSRKKDNL